MSCHAVKTDHCVILSILGFKGIFKEPIKIQLPLVKCLYPGRVEAQNILTFMEESLQKIQIIVTLRCSQTTETDRQHSVSTVTCWTREGVLINILK